MKFFPGAQPQKTEKFSKILEVINLTQMLRIGSEDYAETTIDGAIYLDGEDKKITVELNEDGRTFVARGEKREEYRIRIEDLRVAGDDLYVIGRERGSMVVAKLLPGGETEVLSRSPIIDQMAHVSATGSPPVTVDPFHAKLVVGDDGAIYFAANFASVGALAAVPTICGLFSLEGPRTALLATMDLTLQALQMHGSRIYVSGWGIRVVGPMTIAVFDVARRGVVSEHVTGSAVQSIYVAPDGSVFYSERGMIHHTRLSRPDIAIPSTKGGQLTGSGERLMFTQPDWTVWVMRTGA